MPDLHAMQVASAEDLMEEWRNTRGNAQRTGDVLWEDLDASHARRERDRATQQSVSEWFEKTHVAREEAHAARPDAQSEQVTAGICTIAVRLGRGWGTVDPPARVLHLEFLAPVTEQNTWRPRVSSLLWDDALPYATLVARLVHAMGSNDVSKSGSLHRPYAPDLTPQERRKAQVRAQQAIERGMMSLYYGRAMAEQGRIPHIDTGLTNTAQAGVRYSKGARRTASVGERLLGEQRAFQRCIEMLRGAPYGFPDWGSGGARLEIVTAYMTARAAASHRCSQVGQWPMRVAAVLFFLAPHVVPVARDTAMASLLGYRGHEAFVAAYPHYYQVMCKNVAAPPEPGEPPDPVETGAAAAAAAAAAVAAAVAAAEPVRENAA